MRRLVVALAFVMAVAAPQPAAAASVVATYPVGDQPFGVVADPTDGRVYVANSGGTTVSVVDPATATVSSLNVGSQPGLLALNAAGRRLYVSNSGDGTLSVVNLSTTSVVGTVFGAGGLGVAVNPPVSRAYVAGGNQFVAINTNTNTIATFVGVPGDESWFGVAANTVANEVYVTDITTATPTLKVLHGQTLAILGELALPKPVRFAIGVDEARHLVFLGSEDPAGPPFANSEFYVVDLADPTTPVITHTTPLGGFSGGIALAGNQIFVTDQSGWRVLELDAQTFAVTATTDLPWEPGLAATHPDGRLYVAGRSADVLGAVASVENQAPVIDSLTLSETSPASDAVLTAVATASDPDGDSLTYVFTWKVEGAPVQTTSGPNASSSLDLGEPGNGDGGDTVTVELVVSDGALESAMASATAVVANAAPTVSVSLDDTMPWRTDTLVATAAGEDPDGDTITYTYTWTVDGSVKRVETTTATTDAFELKPEVDNGDQVTVSVIASDGSASSSPATATAVVTPPGHQQ
jgi:YVTN family beta-propeller protein